MHLPNLISIRTLAALALASILAFETRPAVAQSNPLERIFGSKKYEDPPPKKKKKSTTTTTKKKASKVDDDDEKPSPTPRKKASTADDGDARPTSTTRKKNSTADDGDARPTSTTRKKTNNSATSTSKTETAPGKTKAKSTSNSKSAPTPTPTPTPEPTPEPTPVATSTGTGQTSSIESSELKEFAAQPERVKQLLESALALTRRNLTYTYGSADPSRGGMDCSGFIYYVLKEAGFADAPRQSNEQYIWVRKKSVIWAVLSKRSDTFEIKELQPGDLMFWTGTYDIDRDPPVTHTMIYLGTSKKTGKTLMIGSSDGRTYEGTKRNGVSVFDFHVATSAPKSGAPTNGRTPGFAGYGPIPGMR